MTRTFQSVVAGLMMAHPAIAQEQPTDFAGQLAFMGKLGLELSTDITPDDMTYSFPAEDFVSDWPSLMIFVLGIEVEREPWGRRISSDVWNFDFEAIYEPTSYQTILSNLVGLTGQSDLLRRNASHVDMSTMQTTIDYQIGDRSYQANFPQDGDWANAQVVERMMRDIEAATPGQAAFWFMDNGQAMVLMFLEPGQAAKLNAAKADIISPAT